MDPNADNAINDSASTQGDVHVTHKLNSTALCLTCMQGGHCGGNTPPREKFPYTIRGATHSDQPRRGTLRYHCKHLLFKRRMHQPQVAFVSHTSQWSCSIHQKTSRKISMASAAPEKPGHQSIGRIDSKTWIGAYGMRKNERRSSSA